MGQRGFTLIEVVVAAAIAALLVAAGAGVSAAMHPLGSRSAAAQFDAALDYARALAAQSPNGATLVVSARQVAVYSGRPTSPGALVPAPLAPVSIEGAQAAEASLGAAPFALFVDGEGRVTAAAFQGATPAPMATPPPCPPAGAWSVTFTDPRASAVRQLACNAPQGSP